MPIQILPVPGLPIIKPGDDLAQLVGDALRRAGSSLVSGDVLVLCHVIVSRSEGNTVDLRRVEPGEEAIRLAEVTGKDPRLVEVILGESLAVRRAVQGTLITETKHGWVCANAGVDKSNVPGVEIVCPLPEDGDESARRIRGRIRELFGVEVAVIVTDTHGRPHRDGEINVCVGASGLEVIRDRRGEKDLFGYELKVKRTAVADELSSAAELVIGQADEGVPAAVIRGYRYVPSESSSSRQLVRPHEKDLFP